jgi:hypothetical protein
MGALAMSMLGVLAACSPKNNEREPDTLDDHPASSCSDADPGANSSYLDGGECRRRAHGGEPG